MNHDEPQGPIGHDDALASLSLAYVLLGGAVVSLQTVTLINQLQRHNPGCLNRARQSILDAQALIDEVSPTLELSAPRVDAGEYRPEQQLVSLHGAAFFDWLEARSRIKALKALRQHLARTLEAHGQEVHDVDLVEHPTPRLLRTSRLIATLALVAWGLWRVFTG